MPDKEGSEDEKTTKGVVKKKQKQILNQEQTNPVKTFAKTASNALNSSGSKKVEKNYNKKSLDTYRKMGGDGTARYESEEYLPEEEYDRYRDRIAMAGGDHRSKETRERSYTPSKRPKGKTVYQKEAEKKYGKGATALDIVKKDIEKKHGKGAIMRNKK